MGRLFHRKHTNNIEICALEIESTTIYALGSSKIIEICQGNNLQLAYTWLSSFVAFSKIKYTHAS